MWSQTASSHCTSSSIVTLPTNSNWSYVIPLRNQSDQTEAMLKIRCSSLIGQYS